MEIDEVVARVLRRYWPLLLIMTVLPVLVVGAVLQGQAPTYVGATRLNASNNPQDALSGDSGVSTVVSQVKAYATSQDVLAQVIRRQGVARRPKDAATHIEVTALGSSTVVELTLTDRDPGVARKLTGALATQVVRQINESNMASLDSQLQKIDKQISDLNGQLSRATQRLADNPLSISASNTKERLLGEISDLRADRNDLRTRLATAGQARIVQQAVVGPKSAGSTVLLILSGLVGLLAGILISVLAETFRPTIPGPQRVAKRLGVPLLGYADKGPARLTDTGRRVRLAARRAGVPQVTLVGTGGGPVPAPLVSAIAAAVYGDVGKVVGTESHSTPRPGGTRDGGEDVDLPGRLDHLNGSSREFADGAADGPADGPGDGSADGDPYASPSAPGTAGRSVVRSHPAVVGRRAAEVAPAAGQPSAARATHVHAFEDMDPGTDTQSVGVVAVAGPVTRLAELEAIRDLVTASGWPLLGVIATSRRLRG